jgi:ribosomal protein S18 acetylase RimI-like enzyme
MAVIETRAVTRADVQFLAKMLALAAAWRPGTVPPSPDELLANGHYAVYVEDWGRDGDFGVLSAVSGLKTGAAWARAFSPERHGYGYVDASIPEVSIAVVSEARGQGHGRALLDALIVLAKKRGVPALSLSVETDNPAVEFYRWFGFEQVATSGNAFTMLVDLRASGEG